MHNHEEELLAEGHYFCENCKKETKHEYLQGMPLSCYEKLSYRQILDRQYKSPRALTCTCCYKPL